MGQYHLTVNLDKREFIHPHKIGLGLKLRAQLGDGGMGDVLLMLLASANGRGGGDVNTATSGLVGRWAGDRIAVLGDYSEKDDIPGINAADIYYACSTSADNAVPEYSDISDLVVELVNEQFGAALNVSESGWRRR